MEVEVTFDPYLFEEHCVHASGNIHWHMCNFGRLLVLDPATMQFSYLLAPAELGPYCKYRIGETPEEGRLCIVTVHREEMQLWVRGEGKSSDNGWLLEKRMDLRQMYDEVPDLPTGTLSRIFSVWLTDIDAGRTGKLFIRTAGYGRYSFHLKTRKLKRLAVKGGEEYGHPIYAYFPAWPPAFLAPEC